MNPPLQPLDDIRILDLTHFVNGPYATLLLSYLDAEEIKIEPPQWGDGMRVAYCPSPKHQIGMSFAINANKRSINPNLKSNEGKELSKAMPGVPSHSASAFR